MGATATVNTIVGEVRRSSLDKYAAFPPLVGRARRNVPILSPQSLFLSIVPSAGASAF